MANFNKSPDFRAGLDFIDDGIRIIKNTAQTEKVLVKLGSPAGELNTRLVQERPLDRIGLGVKLAKHAIGEHKVSAMAAAISRLAIAEERLGSERAIVDIVQTNRSILPPATYLGDVAHGVSDESILESANYKLREDHRLAEMRYKKTLHGSAIYLPEPIIISGA